MSQAVGETIATDKTTYVSGEAVQVSFGQLPANAKDWITLAPAGSPLSSITTWAYTGGVVTGTIALNTGASGSFVARAFLNDGYTLLAESNTFSVASGATNTNAVSYRHGDSLTVSYSGLPGSTRDWVSIAPSGSPLTTLTSWAYTDGAPSGSTSFVADPLGTFVARTFGNDSYNLVAESAPFTIVARPAAVTDKSSYLQADSVVVTYSNLAGNTRDWISIVADGELPTGYVRWSYTNGDVDGSKSFAVSGLTPGSYHANVHFNDTYEIEATSPSFTVSGAATPSIAADQNAYAATATVVATFSSLPGNALDWVALAHAGAPQTSYVAWTYTAAQIGGSHTFTNVPAGTYVVRAFANNGFSLVAESAVFNVTNGEASCPPRPNGNILLTSQVNDPRFLAVDSTAVYWTEYASRSLKRVPIDGGTPITLAQRAIGGFAIATDALNVYWSADAPSGELLRTRLRCSRRHAP